MSLQVDDTIAAIASAPGGAARGIVRISGPEAIRCLTPVFTAENGCSLSDLRSASVVRGQFDLGPGCGKLPAIAYVWPTRRSYTRQISAELHLPGSPPLLEAALNAVLRGGARIARPGEFTLRAFLAGRLDLTQAEAVLGVIDAESSTQLQTALGQLAGGLAGPLNSLRGELLDLLAHLEAGLDFVEEDIEFISAEELTRQLRDAQQRVQSIARQMQSRGEVATQRRIALVGLPNAGKSSLLNALAGEAVAIVSNVAGTTRDYVTRIVTIDGIDCLLVDTAGVETLDDAESIEAAAQTLASQQATQADLTLLCLDATQPRSEWEQQQLATPDDKRIVVLTKADQLEHSPDSGFCSAHDDAVLTSSVDGCGIDRLKQAIALRLQSLQADANVVAGTAARCRESLHLAAESLSRGLAAAGGGLGDELVAAEVRSALDELGRVVGAIYTDDVLDRIFSRFCIGK